MRKQILWIVLCLWVLAVACRSVAPAATPTPETLPAVETGQPPVVPATDTPVPSPTVEAAPRALLLALEGGDPAVALALQPVLADLAAKDGLQFETLTQLPALEFGPEVKLVVAVPPDPGLANLAAANPQTSFLAVGIPGLQAGGNLSVVGGGGTRPDQQGFLAGYLAAVLTPDWRVGVVVPAGSVEGRAARNGFTNGLVFFCGLCRPAYPPFVQYPITTELQPGAGETELQQAVALMTSNGVQMVYVAPGLEGGGLLEALGAAGLKLIGSAPPPAALQGQWVASVQAEASDAVQQIWPLLLAGQGGITIDAPVSLTYRNPELLSTGRQRLVDSLLSDLLSGLVDTGIDQQTGEVKP